MYTEKGFTLFEMVATVVLLGIIASAASQMITKDFEAFYYLQNKLDASNEVSFAKNRLAYITQNVNWDETNDRFSLSTATSTNLVFTDVNGNTITIDGSSLPAINVADSQVAGAYPLMKNATTFTIDYLDNTFSTTAVLDSIRFIRFNIGYNANNASLSDSVLVGLRER